MFKEPEVTGCAFCDTLAKHKWANRIANQIWEDKSECPTKHEYTVALIDRAWKRSKSNASRWVDYRNKGIGFKLNFCPECGREIHGVKRGR